MAPPIRVAVVGGGPAGLSAAFHLTEWKGQLEQQLDTTVEITVYQLGWRLGGKGATGRDAAAHHRIEEHGIHLFGNFYFDTWTMMRKVFEQVGNGYDTCLPVQTLDAAFLPSSTSLTIENVGGCWETHVSAMPAGEGKPWDEDIDVSKSEIVLGLLRKLVTRDRPGEPAELDFLDLVPSLEAPELLTAARRLHETVTQTYEFARQVFVQYPTVTRFARTRRLEEPAQREGPPAREGGRPRERVPVEILQQTMEESRTRLEPAVEALQVLRRDLRRQEHARVQRALSTVDLGLAIFWGLLSEGFWLPSFDLDDLDSVDYRDWLEAKGATPETVDSATVISVSNIVFAYPEGDTTREPRLSAASWLNWILRSVIGHGEYFQFFAAGSGETVMLPIYRALQARGVSFEFFHKLTGVETSGASGQYTVEKLVFQRQAVAAQGPYDPLARFYPGDGAGLGWCVWPNQPDWNQLDHGDVNQSAAVDFEEWDSGTAPHGATERVLEHGADGGFDYVVWAIPPSMIPEVGDANLQDEWKDTVAFLPTTATQAIQLWLTEDTHDLGWSRDALPNPPEHSRYASATFPNPLSGMVAFDDLLAYEGWPAPQGPKGLIYLCGQFQDLPGPQSREADRMRVVQAASASLRLAGNFLVEARPDPGDRPDPQAVDFGILYDPDPGHHGEERLSFQYARANTRPTEAYVQAPAGSLEGRRYAWDAGFENLVVAGDWTYTGLNLGAFESAVSGGKAAAFALVGGVADDELAEELVSLTFLHPETLERAGQALTSGRVPMIK